MESAHLLALSRLLKAPFWLLASDQLLRTRYKTEAADPVIQRLILIPQPEKFLLPISFTNVRTKFHEGIVNGYGHCIGMIQIAGTLDSNSPLVVGAAGRTPRAILLLHAKCNLPILSDTIITAGLSGGTGKTSADALRCQLTDHTVGRDPVNGMCPLTGMIGT